MKTSQKLLLTGVIGSLIPLALYASDQVNGVYNFVDLEPILTEEVNENFQHLAGLINSTENVAHISVDEGTGNVGIGTTEPTTAWSKTLQVYGESNADLSVKTDDNEWHMVTDSATAGLFFTEGPSYLRRLIIAQGGNVGIGTTSPSEKLHIGGSAADRGIRVDSGYPEYGNGRFISKTSGGGLFISQNVDSSGNLDDIRRSGQAINMGYGIDGILFNTYAAGANPSTESTKMVILDAGNVGIGTMKPATKLAIAGSDDPNLNSGVERDYAGGGLTFMSTGGFSVAQIGTVQPTGYYYDAGDLVFKTSDGSLDERMRIQGGSGNVGIGTTTPSQRLHVDGNIRVNSSDGIDSHVGFYSGEVEGGFIFYDASEDNMAVRHRDAADNQLTLSGYGNVGIGTASPSQRLHVIGNILASGSVYQNSDLRLKADIAPLENASEGIACLEGVTYRWNDPASSQDLQIGLIAQDVERCFPEVVTTDPKGYKSVSYDRLVAPLVEAVKEQHSLNASQQLEIARLRADQSATRSELASTNARLAKLEALLNSRR